MTVDPVTGPAVPGPQDAAAIPAPTPAGAPVRPSLGTARMADGTTLRTIRWEVPEPRAVAEIVHGLGEHGGRYGTVAAALTGAGIETWSYDHRGNGASGGPRVHVDRWAQLHEDLEARLLALRDLHPGRPLVLFGHSLGGLVACGYVLSPQPRHRPDLLVLSAPALDDDQPAWQRPAARVVNRLLPRMTFANGVPSGGLSTDPAVEEQAAADPLCSTRSTARFGYEAFREQDRVRGLLAGLAAMPVPTYVLHGSEDPVVPVRVTEVFERLGNAMRVVNEGLRHEQHHEPSHAAVLAGVVAWIDAQLAAPPAENGPDQQTV